MRMKLLIVVLLIMGINKSLYADGYTYGVTISSTGKTVNICDKEPGNYSKFVNKYLKNYGPMLGMKCTDVNKSFKDKFVVMCADSSMNVMTVKWFQSKKECETSRLKDKKDS